MSVHLNSVKGYILTVLTGLLLTAATILVILQWGNEGNFSMYGKNMVVNQAVLILAAMAAGVLLIPILKLLWSGVRGIRRGRLEGRLEKLDKIETDQKKHPPTATE